MESKSVAANSAMETAELPGQDQAESVRFDISIGVKIDLQDASRQRVRALALVYERIA
jgi:hypothetical protein